MEREELWGRRERQKWGRDGRRSDKGRERDTINSNGKVKGELGKRLRKRDRGRSQRERERVQRRG